MSPRADPIRVRHAVLIASAIGLKGAARQLGVSSTRICEWRTRLERETGERFPRRHDRKGKRRPFPLTTAQVRALRARRARGVSWGVLARIYRVSPTTCRRAAGTLPMQQTPPNPRSPLGATWRLAGSTGQGTTPNHELQP